MRLRLLAPLILLSCLSTVSVLSQSKTPTPDPEKEKKIEAQKDLILKMLDESVAAANALRLPENRAALNAMTADLYWRFDEKRARELFRNAAIDVTNFYADSEREKRDNNSPGTMVFSLSDPNDPRNVLLPLVARHDAALALELLLQTRSPKLADAVARASQQTNKGPVSVMNFDIDQYRVQQEIGLEQQYALLAAEDDPDKAAALIKDALAKGVTTNVMPLLQKLYKKDEKRAVDLGGDVIRKLVDSDMVKNQNDMITAITFLQNAVKSNSAPSGSGTGTAAGGTDTSATAGSAAAPPEKQFAFTDAQIRDLANKLVNTLLQPSTSITTTAIMTQAIPILEKIVPERAAALKQRQAESQRSLPPELKGIGDMQKIFDPASSPEDTLAQIAKMPDGPIKTQAYSSLQGKIGQITDDARAKKLIDQIPDDKERSMAQEKYDSAKIARTAAAGKLEDARTMIGAMTNRRDRIQKLVDLGVQYFKKGGDANVDAAKAIMKDARSLTGDYAGDGDEMNDMMEVVRGYTTIEPETAFRMFEPVIDQLNEYVQASAVINKYEKGGKDFRNSELVLSNNTATRSGGNLAFRYMTHMQALGRTDLEHMAQLVERFARSDYRALVRIYVLRGLLSDDKKSGVTSPQFSNSTIIVG